MNVHQGTKLPLVVMLTPLLNSKIVREVNWNLFCGNAAESIVSTSPVLRWCTSFNSWMCLTQHIWLTSCLFWNVQVLCTDQTMPILPKCTQAHPSIISYMSSAFMWHGFFVSSPLRSVSYQSSRSNQIEQMRTARWLELFSIYWIIFYYSSWIR